MTETGVPATPSDRHAEGRQRHQPGRLRPLRRHRVPRRRDAGRHLRRPAARGPPARRGQPARRAARPRRRGDQEPRRARDGRHPGGPGQPAGRVDSATTPTASPTGRGARRQQRRGRRGRRHRRGLSPSARTAGPRSADRREAAGEPARAAGDPAHARARGRLALRASAARSPRATACHPGGAVSVRVPVPLDRYGTDVLSGDWRVPEERTRRRGADRDRHGRRGGHHRLVRRGRRRRPRHRHADPGGPPRQAAYVPARPGLPARGQAGDPHPPGPRRRTGRPHAYGVRARSPCHGARPASPAPAGSSSRAATTPSSSRRSGATTCASRASSWSTSAASTTSPTTCATSSPARSAASACWSTTWCRGRRRRGSRPGHRPLPRRQARAGRRPPVHRRLAGRQARPPRHPPWPSVPKGIDWKTGTCQQLGWPHRDQADIARAWKHILAGSAPTPTSSPPCSAGSRSSSTSRRVIARSASHDRSRSERGHARLAPTAQREAPTEPQRPQTSDALSRRGRARPRRRAAARAA